MNFNKITVAEFLRQNIHEHELICDLLDYILEKYPESVVNKICKDGAANYDNATVIKTLSSRIVEQHDVIADELSHLQSVTCNFISGLEEADEPLEEILSQPMRNLLGQILIDGSSDLKSCLFAKSNILTLNEVISYQNIEMVEHFLSKIPLAKQKSGIKICLKIGWCVGILYFATKMGMQLTDKESVQTYLFKLFDKRLSNTNLIRLKRTLSKDENLDCLMTHCQSFL